VLVRKGNFVRDYSGEEETKEDLLEYMGTQDTKRRGQQKVRVMPAETTSRNIVQDREWSSSESTKNTTKVRNNKIEHKVIWHAGKKLYEWTKCHRYIILIPELQNQSAK